MLVRAQLEGILYNQEWQEANEEQGTSLCPSQHKFKLGNTLFNVNSSNNYFLRILRVPVSAAKAEHKVWDTCQLCTY